MALIDDVRAARRLVRNAFASRRSRRTVLKVEREQRALPPRTVQIAVYFADTRVNLYQLRQWYAPLAELQSTWPVAIISRSPGTVLELWNEAPVPAVYARSVQALEQFVHEQDIRIVLYVNQNAKNFQMFRYGRMWHVFVNHGESDKMYMTTNQFKAYDYSFVAGDAALDRLRTKLWDFDLEKRAIPIGRPQADHLGGEVPFEPDGRTVVLYAPTWEGDRAAAAYGSIASHGVAIANAVLASPQHRLVYRPHPRSGVLDTDYRAANREIIAAIARANTADPTARHVYDDGPELGWQLAVADVAITDISAMVYDRLATGKPLLVTRPVSAEADVDEHGYLGSAQWVLADSAGDVLTLVDRALHDRGARASLRYWAKRHFGDTTPGAATHRFRAAIQLLMDRWEEHAALHDRDPDDSGSDPFGDDDERE
ncbi:MAG TPA: CDP-glycerol glycerophosphotransferase family protein [Rhodoglobus sp.]|nr:CDP-glycerol glycerophosphotransferase family protein [Rhodoglobus sp.]